jgi:hypothetical protein
VLGVEFTPAADTMVDEVGIPVRDDDICAWKNNNFFFT